MQLRLTLLVFILLSFPISLLAKVLNGFNIDNASVPLHLIQRGGPPKDGIPALNQPEFIKGKDAKFMRAQDIVLGLQVSDVVKAYPIRILNWHEIVNDQFGGTRYVISYCPLCGSGMAFLSQPTGELEALDFGVSGLLYNSDVLMYDRKTESLWSQIHGEAIAGASVGSKLKQVPLTLSRWSNWLARHPDSLVLSTNTGYQRDYQRDPYAGYGKNAAIYFPVANQAPNEYHPKEMVLGFKVEQSTIAFPFSELSQLTGLKHGFELAGSRYFVHWDSDNQSAWITNDKGKTQSSTLLFWFAWYAFYPDTKVYKLKESDSQVDPK
ncbi:hypothetical protein VTH8203_02896 [Vibrio thalassae]|uniref:DUF3179 domain-containing protein n=1 Tax=Vibrio thalassae TaxID=1243014 RepID=A0A240ELW8_9VIBR|nr:DUF3179 domain-containing protein [Vibrio thalassae]SNX49253.1 hypothetical protein VTH8203_02896 [Vibrio thalassae]